MPTEKIN